MGIPSEPPQAKLVCGFIACSVNAVNEALFALEERFGPHDLESEAVPFNFTDYYEPEMGKTLLRRFFAFPSLIKQSDLADIKLFTQEIEESLSSAGRFGVARPVNLDPGFVSSSKLVLATTKDYSHRIYLGRGIFAEVTLYFRAGTFHPWPWTYPDYRVPGHIEFFNKVRATALGQLGKEK